MPRTRTATPREAKVSELLDAAEDLFARQGTANTSTAQLARAAGVSEKTLFWYFPSKDHLLVAVVERRAQRLFARLRRSGWPTGDPAEDLFRILRGLRPLRHLLPMLHQRAEASAHVSALREQFRTGHQQLLAASVRALGIPPREVDAVVVIILSFADGVLLRNVPDAQLQRLCRLLVAHLKTRPTTPTT